MDKLAERIGLYDIWAVFFPGAIGLIGIAFCYYIYQILRNSPDANSLIIMGLPTNISGWIIFIFAAIFYGIILQEFARIFRNALKFRKAEEGLLDYNVDIFSNKEIQVFTPIYQEFKYEKKNKSFAESRRLFHCMNIEAQEIGVASRFVKLNVLYAMYMSLAMAVLVNIFGFFYEVLYFIHVNNAKGYVVSILLDIVFLFLLILFILKAQRYKRFWVRNIVYSVSASISKNTMEVFNTNDNAQNNN